MTSTLKGRRPSAAKADASKLQPSAASSTDHRGLTADDHQRKRAANTASASRVMYGHPGTGAPAGALTAASTRATVQLGAAHPGATGRLPGQIHHMS